MRQLGIITSMTPPTVLLDGATTGSPAALVNRDHRLKAGDRVVCDTLGRTLIIEYPVDVYPSQALTDLSPGTSAAGLVLTSTGTGSSWQPSPKTRMATGTATLNWSGSTISGEATINFAPTFGGLPIVLVTGWDANDIGAVVNARSATTSSFKARGVTGTAATIAWTFRWLAIDPTTL